MSQASHTPVLIAGAGPTGLVLATWLRKNQIPFRIIDKTSRPGTTSRALAVQARTLEFYHQLGLSEALIRAGTTVPEIILRRRGKIVSRGYLGAVGKNITPYPYLLFCPQDVHETLLNDELGKMGVEIERDTELVEFKQDDGKVTAILRSPRGTEVVTADYLCGCDGAHSVVRHGMPTEFPGGTYSQMFFVADVVAEGAMAEGLQISLSTESFCIVMPVRARGTIRLTGVIPLGSEKDDTTFEDVRASVMRDTGLTIKDVLWYSSYHVHHRVAKKFRQGRVFLAGDAGHIHSPAGGQGMNTGIGDAVNLAWKLACVLKGQCSEKILETYEPERMAFAKVLVKTTDTAFKFIASPTWVGSLFRAYILPIVFTILTRLRPGIRFAFRTLSQTRINYRNSFLSKGFVGEISGGDRLPWVSYGDHDNFAPLATMDWQIHIYGHAQTDFIDAMKTLGLQVHVFAMNKEARRKGFGEDGAYLIRPDGYVGLALEFQESQTVKDYLKTIGFKNTSEVP
jgi:2-polyprenyl-6-methoxyphenol hydroxylase-like FAD-dependent oxidoreductase